jgi:sodium/proline symporter
MDSDANATGIILVTLVIYKLVLIGIGIWAARFNKNESDFFLGGRALGPWVAGLSYAASTSSAWVLLGFSGFVYATGVSALWMVPGIWAGYVIVWLWFGPKLREETAAHGHVTVTDFMVSGLPVRTGRIIAALSAFLVLFTFVFYIAAQFGAAAIAFESQFALGRTESVLIGAGVILIYGLLGGFWAVSLTDTLQGFMMALIALLLPIIGLIAAGGPIGVLENLSATMPATYLDPFGGMAGFAFLGFAVGIASIGLGTLGQPHLMSRLMAVRDDKSRRQGFAIAMVWAVIVFTGMAVLALSGRALIGSIGDDESLFYAMASTLLPAALAGIVIAAVLSAVMSTVDSLLIAAAAAAAHDLGLVRLLKGREVLVSRMVMALICAFAVVLTLSVDATIFDRVLFSWSALGAAFGPIIVARVSGITPSGLAMLLAILLGFFTTVLFYTFGQIGVDGAGGGLSGYLAQLAAIPGDPFERIVPWFAPLMLCFLVRQKTVLDAEPA